jgi:hypothetical protein
MIGEHHPAERRRPKPGHFEDSDAGERADHTQSVILDLIQDP